MTKTHLVITTDYELFGNGSGDVKNCMINPTDLMMELLDKYGAKLTVFAEMMEYWKIKEAINEGLLSVKDYNPCLEIEKQLKKMIFNGHDVQFHMHPQWVDAIFHDGRWHLNYKYWRTPLVPGGLGNVKRSDSLIGLFSQGKKCLEKLGKSVNKNYECIGFRAGSYCIQPHKLVFEAMEKTGFVFDSSVFPYGFERSRYSYYDFRKITNANPYRPNPKDISLHDPNGPIVEMPIYSRNLYLPLSFTYSLLPKKYMSPKGCVGHGFNKKKMKREKPNFKRVKRWDFCMMNHIGLKTFLLSGLSEKKKDINVLIMTSHPKSYNNNANFERFLKFAKRIVDKNENICFSTLTDAVKDYIQFEKRD